MNKSKKIEIEKNTEEMEKMKINEQIENGDKVSVFPIHEYWRDIGKWNDYNQAQLDVENNF